MGVSSWTVSRSASARSTSAACPTNDRIGDTTFRTHTFVVNRPVTQIGLQVGDITDLSEIFLDDLQVSNGAATTPTSEPATFGLTLGAIAVLAAFAKIRPGRLAGSRR